MRDLGDLLGRIKATTPWPDQGGTKVRPGLRSKVRMQVGVMAHWRYLLGLVDQHEKA